MGTPRLAGGRRGVALLALFASAALVAPACSPSEEDIKQEIEAARACSSTEECVDVGSACPFGCAIVVNKSHAGRIRQLVEGYRSNCVYDCLAVKAITCEASRCTAKTE